MNRRLKRSLLEQKQAVKPNVQQIPGLLGIPLDGQKRVEVSGRDSYVYVRLRSNSSEVIQAFNNKVAAAYNLPVLVERQGNRYTVSGVDTQRYENNWNSFAPFLPRHANTHSFDTDTGGGGDVVWVYPRQITPLLIMPSGSVGGPNVIVNPYTLKMDNGTWKYVGNTGTANLTTYNPAGSTGAVLVLIYMDTVTGNPGFVVGSGSVFLNSITGASQITPYIPSVTDPTWIPLGAVRLITGTSRIGWDNIYDVRQFLHNTPTGTAGGGGGGGTPGGSNLEIQYNDNGSFGGANIIYTGTSTYSALISSGPYDYGLNFYIFGEKSVGMDQQGGVVSINGGDSPGSGTAGGVVLQGGDSKYGGGGTIHINAGDSLTSGTGGIVEIKPGFGYGGSHGFFSVNDPASDWQHRFRTSGSTTHHDYGFPDESGTLLLDAPSNGTTYGRKDVTWIPVSSGGSSTIKENGGLLGTADTFDFVGNGIGDVSISGTTVRVFTDVEDGFQAFGYNYVITPSVSNGALTVALKTISGNNPSPTDKLVFRVGDSRKEVTSALSHTIPTGTNWCNAGSSEIGEQQVDWFVYLIDETGASAGLKIGISRIPYAQTMEDFVNSSTNEKYIVGNWVNFNNSDKVENIGLFTATLSKINKVWSMVNPYIISRPVYETRWMNWSPTYSASGSMTFTSVTTNVAVYKISGRDVRIHIRATGTTGGTASSDIRVTLPFDAENALNNPTLPGYINDGAGAISGFIFIVGSTPDYAAFRKYDSSNYGLGAGRIVNTNGSYQIAS